MKLERSKILKVLFATSISFSVLLSSCELAAKYPESTGQTTLNSDLSAVTLTSTNSVSQGLIPNQNPLQINRLEMVSQGITYQLIEHWVYSKQNGVIADGKWFDKLALEMDPTLKADLKAAKEIPYADDFTFMQVGSGKSEKAEVTSMNIFDENLKIIQRNDDKPLIPSEAGLYYVAVFYSWSEKDSNFGVQYLFKTRRQ